MSRNSQAVAAQTVVSDGGAASAALGSASAQQQQWEVQAAAVCRLGVYGYTPSECQGALARCQGNEHMALEDLYGGLTGAHARHA